VKLTLDLRGWASITILHRLNATGRLGLINWAGFPSVRKFLLFLRSSGKRVMTQSLRTVEGSKEDVGCWMSKNALMAAVVLRTERIVLGPSVWLAPHVTTNPKWGWCPEPNLTFYFISLGHPSVPVRTSHILASVVRESEYSRVRNKCENQFLTEPLQKRVRAKTSIEHHRPCTQFFIK